MSRLRLPTHWIAREIAVNWIGHKPGLRSLAKRTVINNTATSIVARASAIPPTGCDLRLGGANWLLHIECVADGAQYGYIDGVYSRYRKRKGRLSDPFASATRDWGRMSLSHWLSSNRVTLIWLELVGDKGQSTLS